MPRASVSSCLNTIGRKIVSFEMFSAGGFIRDALTECKVRAAANPFAKLVYSPSWTTDRMPWSPSLAFMEKLNLASCSFF